MANLTLKMRVIELRGPYKNVGGIRTGTGSYEFTHPVIYLKAGTFAGDKLTYYDPGGGLARGYENQRAAWKTLSLAIQSTKSLTFATPQNPDIERFYRKHTTLSEKLNYVSILAYIDRGSESVSYNPSPDQRIDIVDVTVIPSMLTIQGVTWIGMQYSGTTKEWF